MSRGQDSAEAKFFELLGSCLRIWDVIEGSMKCAGEAIACADHRLVARDVELVIGGDASENKSIGTVFGEDFNVFDHCIEIFFRRAKICFGLSDHDEDRDIDLRF
jgi:hypothetical protein